MVRIKGGVFALSNHHLADLPQVFSPLWNLLLSDVQASLLLGLGFGFLWAVEDVAGLIALAG